ncbi:MAG: RsmB/NOP family class I SAM-dependent RNA methyltransferase [candidate division WOR-3 bacterium]
MQLPDKFLNRYRSIIPDFDRFIEALNRPLKTVIRLNTLKGDKEEILSLLSDYQLEPIPWYSLAYRIKNDIHIGNRLEHFLGLVYSQEAASLIPPLVLDPKPYEKILDIAAAPGSKTTQMACMMKNTGLIVANDPSRKRLQPLIANLDRCGTLNVVVTNKKGERLGELLPGFFDRVLVDAPCSVEGMIRKSSNALIRWSESNIIRLSMLQKALLVSAFRTLKPGGVLVYSTCTIAPEENEAVVSFLLERNENAQIEPINLPGLITRPGLTHWQRSRFHPDLPKAARIYPQDNDTESFFIAKIRKLNWDV